MPTTAGKEVMKLGYDIREPAGWTGATSWTPARRSAFLLRPDVLQPLSVDRGVWPQATKMLNEASPLMLWGSVSEALDAFASTCSGAPFVIEIAIVDISEVPQDWINAFQGTLHPEKDQRTGLDFVEYGYDVADQYLLSGLSNCMLSAVELENVRSHWAQRLNHYGLFRKRTDAAEFTKVCNVHVPEHAPFFSYRLRRVAIQRG
jgi:hypothetical protein